MRKDYNKLVRDKVPSIIEAIGKDFLMQVLSNDEYERALTQKLVEEAKEVQAAKSTNQVVAELADVIDTLIVVLGISWQEVREIQKQKRLERGGFEKQLKLMWVDERNKSLSVE